MDLRYQELCQWVAKELGQNKVELSVVSGDASFRRYFRYRDEKNSWIVMDAPPEKEDSRCFVSIATSWLAEGVNVPEIKALDLAQGFMLLSDFGEHLLLSVLNPDCPNHDQGKKYYSKAMQSLVQMQQMSNSAGSLPPYDRSLLQQEMSLFDDWLLKAKLGITLSACDKEKLTRCCELLENRALAQDQVTVHRDYHARNLMICQNDSLGIIDFQDAVEGPITYDLVSLLRDCYIVWPDELVTQWCQEFYDLLLANNLFKMHPGKEFIDFKEDFDLMGLQRHLKVAGIFSRLSLRDGKHQYLADIPTTLEYILNVSKQLILSTRQDYSSLAYLITLVEEVLLPKSRTAEFLTGSGE